MIACLIKSIVSTNCTSKSYQENYLVCTKKLTKNSSGSPCSKYSFKSSVTTFVNSSSLAGASNLSKLIESCKVDD